MITCLVCLIAISSTSICLFVWFRDVRRIMRSRMSVVESAAGQLSVCREKAAQIQGSPDSDAVLARSESIYRQAVDLYNQTIRNPWIYLPAVLMGFKPVSPPEKQQKQGGIL